MGKTLLSTSILVSRGANKGYCVWLEHCEGPLINNGDLRKLDINTSYSPSFTGDLVFNSYYRGHWQTEERGTRTVYSNGHLLHDFQERQSGWSITSIDIGGDVHVHSVQIE
ncbi:galactoside-binding lectin [Cooperia oncophora]